MAWTYSGDPSTSDKDALRFAIFDTNPDEPLFQDEELNYLLSTYYTSEAELMYQLYSQAAVIFSRNAMSKSLGPLSEDTRQRGKYYADKAAEAKADMLSHGAPGAAISAMPRAFRKQMFSNPNVSAPGGDYVQ